MTSLERELRGLPKDGLQRIFESLMDADDATLNEEILEGVTRRDYAIMALNVLKDRGNLTQREHDVYVQIFAKE